VQKRFVLRLSYVSAFYDSGSDARLRKGKPTGMRLVREIGSKRGARAGLIFTTGMVREFPRYVAPWNLEIRSYPSR
jgi:hypothetical protein